MARVSESCKVVEVPEVRNVLCLDRVVELVSSDPLSSQHH
jgi:hypothetical protein